MIQKQFKKGRVILSLLFFVLIIVSFADIKGNIPAGYFKTVLYLQFIPSLLKLITPGTIISLGAIFVIILTFAGGRVYCSTICPLGVMQDIIIFVKRKISSKKRLKFKKALNLIRYPILVLGIVSLFFGGILFFNWLDPYANFGRIGAHIIQPVILGVNNLIAKILPSVGLMPLEARPFHFASFAFAAGVFLLVGIMSFFSGRLYCNTVCPVGTLLGLLSKVSLFKIRIDASSCTKCGKCQAACKANCINIKTLEVDETRCVSCFNCIPVCEDSSIKYKLSSKLKTQPAIAADNTDSKRRFLMVSAVGYLTAKSVSVFGAEEKNHVCFWRRGTVAPPGSLSIEHLKDRCVSCHLCISVCPTKVLQPSWLEYGVTGMLMPKMDFMHNFCNYECTKCGEVCPTGAIIHLPPEEKKLTQIGKVQFVQDDCIVETEGTSCGSCSEHCPTQAVKMVPYKNGLTIPETDTSICIGCGACEYACPVKDPHKAIFVASSLVHARAEKPKSEKIEYEETEEFPF
ncbi:MAG: 4Fe-4S dicluster domain-containing protein [Bacteroidales bacterium]|nr:4Fe-4S dicluster domain-containing protein [Bacteroidales bacterium]MBN2820507.1 4Fe-4S dicluster domain-containing protein [Bacteroidales bacterium]